MVVLPDVADASLIRFLSGSQWRREHGEREFPATPAREPYRGSFAVLFQNGVPQGRQTERRERREHPCRDARQKDPSAFCLPHPCVQ